MDNIGTGHWIFAGVFAIAFIVGIGFAYQQDFKRIRANYKRVWMIIAGILLVYFAIFFLYKL